MINPWKKNKELEKKIAALEGVNSFLSKRHNSLKLDTTLLEMNYNKSMRELGKLRTAQGFLIDQFKKNCLSSIYDDTMVKVLQIFEEPVQEHKSNP